MVKAFDEEIKSINYVLKTNGPDIHCDCENKDSPKQDLGKCVWYIQKMYYERIFGPGEGDA